MRLLALSTCVSLLGFLFAEAAPANVADSESANSIANPQEPVTSKVPAAATSSCIEPGNSRATRTINFDDIDTLQATRVPVPRGYNGFTFSDPSNNTILRSEDSINVNASVPNILHANKGIVAMGAVGFSWLPLRVSISTSLERIDFATLYLTTKSYNGIYGDTGQSFLITADRQFVEIEIPPTPFDNIPHEGTVTVFEVLDGRRYSPGRVPRPIPFYIDNIVYARSDYPTTCCQLNNPNPVLTVTFDDLHQGTGPPVITNPFLYGSWNFSTTQRPGAELFIGPATVDNPSRPYSLHQRPTFDEEDDNNITLQHDGIIDLLSLTITIPQIEPNLYNEYETGIEIRGFNCNGSELCSQKATFQTSMSAVAAGNYTINIGGDWKVGNTGGLYVKGREGGGGDSSQLSTGRANFRSIDTIKVYVYKDTYYDLDSPRYFEIPFSIDNIRYQLPYGNC